MKTKQGKAISAYNALLGIQGRKEVTTTKTGKALFDMKRALRPAFEFQCEREKEIIERLGGMINPENGMIVFPEGENKTQKFIELKKEFEEIANLEIDVDAEPITIFADEELHINMDEMEALDGFVEFG